MADAPGGNGAKLTHLTVSPEGATTPTERGFDDPDFQRCDGCDSGLIVEDPAEPWQCPFCPHLNMPQGPKLCSDVRRDWRGSACGTGIGGRPKECPECGGGS